MLNGKTTIIQEKIEKFNQFLILQHEWELESTKLKNTIDCINREFNIYCSK
jgi:hypothetical protein